MTNFTGWNTTKNMIFQPLNGKSDPLSFGGRREPPCRSVAFWGDQKETERLQMDSHFCETRKLPHENWPSGRHTGSDRQKRFSACPVCGNWANWDKHDVARLASDASQHIGETTLDLRNQNHGAMGQKPNRTLSEYPNPTTKVGSLKWAVNSPTNQNGNCPKTVLNHGHLGMNLNLRTL